LDDAPKARVPGGIGDAESNRQGIARERGVEGTGSLGVDVEVRLIGVA
jgi:hypothetical protein